jgi:drug/metabolite transporter (DMT)-like permease
MIGYLGIVYGFLGDVFIFGVEFTPMQIVGVCVILVFCVSMIFYNQWNAKRNSKIEAE